MKKITYFMAVLCCLLLAGCGYTHGQSLTGTSFRYDYPEKYTVGNGSVTGTVRHLDIDWLSGSVEIVYGTGSRIEIEETFKGELSDDLIMRWQLDGDTLRVKFCNSGRWDMNNLQKTLTVTLPGELTLESAEITTVSADIRTEELNVEEIDFNTTSGDMDICLGGTANIDLLTVSGAVRAVVRGEVKEADVDSTSGDIDLEMESAEELKLGTVSGRVTVTAGSIERAEMDSTSGNIALRLERSEGECEIGTVSGRVTLELPGDAHPAVKFSTVSGRFESDVEVTVGGDRNGGPGFYQVSTTSGDLRIEKNGSAR